MAFRYKSVSANLRGLCAKDRVFVLTYILPELNSFDGARRIRESLPKVAIVILSAHADSHFIREAKKIGVRAYVPKSEASIALVKAVEAAIVMTSSS